MKNTILLLLIFSFLAIQGCSNFKLTEDAGILNVDPGDDKTAYVGDTVTFEGDCSVKWGFYKPLAEWDFGDGASEDGFEATHVYTEPGDYTAEFTVTLRYYSVRITKDINVKINPLPLEAAVTSENPVSVEKSISIMNPCKALLPDGRIVAAGTYDQDDASEIIIALEEPPGSGLFNFAQSFIQNDTRNLPDDIEVLDDGNIIVWANDAFFYVPLNNQH